MRRRVRQVGSEVRALQPAFQTPAQLVSVVIINARDRAPGWFVFVEWRSKPLVHREFLERPIDRRDCAVIPILVRATAPSRSHIVLPQKEDVNAVFVEVHTTSFAAVPGRFAE